MSTSITTAFITAYERKVHDVFQRNGSRLKPGVRMKTGVIGSTAVFQVIGKGVATTKARHGTITPMNQSHTAPSVTLADFYAGDWVDRLDEAKINIDERDAIARGGAMAIGRKVDDQILTALDATTQSTVTITITSAATIRNSFTSAIGDLITLDSFEDDQMYGVLSPKAWEMLMTLDQFQNADNVGTEGMEFAKAVALGVPTLKKWMGVKWMFHSGVPGVGTATSKMFVWNKRAIGYATGDHPANLASVDSEVSIGADITWHGDRAAHFVNHAMSGGALLIDDTGVIEMNMDDTGTVPTS